MKNMKKFSAIFLILAIFISIFSSLNVTAYAQETITMTDSEINQLVDNELLSVMDEVLNYTNDMYTVNEDNKLEIIPNSTNSIVNTVVQEFVINQLNVALDEESQQKISTAFYESVTDLYNSLLDYYNEDI